MKNATDEEGWQRFLSLCLECKTQKELESFFELLLTFDERSDIGGRMLIIKELLNGNKTQREMAKDLQVSIAKITRGSNSLKGTGEDLRGFLINNIN